MENRNFELNLLPRLDSRVAIHKTDIPFFRFFDLSKSFFQNFSLLF